MRKDPALNVLAGLLFAIYGWFFMMAWQNNLTPIGIVFCALLNIALVVSVILFFIKEKKKEYLAGATMCFGGLMILVATSKFAYPDLFFWVGIVLGGAFIIISMIISLSKTQ